MCGAQRESEGVKHGMLRLRNRGKINEHGFTRETRRSSTARLEF